ncbi:hypothetical protein EsH8_IV_001154 [Colletotrichum jinshuiense]
MSGVWHSDYYNTTYDDEIVGTLGLGKTDNQESQSNIKSTYGMPDTVLEQMTRGRVISTASWYMHMASVSLGQSPSLTLGGYERNRALGDIGTFPMDEELPRVFLIDVALGVETGGSPFTNEYAGSVWQGIGNDERGKNLVKSSGGPTGSAMVLPNAAVPYIYLPPGTCEAAAAQIPVKWNEHLGLYLWDENQPTLVSRLINSPAYMAFTFSDEDATNITVKVPFKLLNLTLNRSPSRDWQYRHQLYWPCKPWDITYKDDAESGGENRWQLGRAFLQGAFVGFNYVRGKFYMAQAPGPDMGQHVTLDDNLTTIYSDPSMTFAESWKSSWAELPTHSEEVGPEYEYFDEPADLGRGPKAVIAVGAVICAVALFASIYLIRRRVQRQKQSRAADDDGGVFTGGKPEMDGQGVHEAKPLNATAPSELNGIGLAEMPSPTTPLIYDGLHRDGLVYELPAEDVESRGGHGRENSKRCRSL